MAWWKDNFGTSTHNTFDTVSTTLTTALHDIPQWRYAVYPRSSRRGYNPFEELVLPDKHEDEREIL